VGQQTALTNASGNTGGLDSPALRQAIPRACLVLACEHVETWSPDLARVADLDSEFRAHCSCASKDAHDAELRVLSTLGWDIAPLSAIDVVQELLYIMMAPLPGTSWQRAELKKQISKELHLNLLVAAICENLCRKTPA